MSAKLESAWLAAEPTVAFANAAERTLLKLQRMSMSRKIDRISARQLITERADYAGFPLGRPIAAGGGCRLMETAGGMVAFSLPRKEDWSLLPALFEGAGPDDGDWAALAMYVRQTESETLIARGAALGLAVAPADAAAPNVAEPYRVVARGPIVSRSRSPIVLDMSALWGGPLCGHLLERMGARVIKLESFKRPDGGRRGNASFYALLNQHKQCVAIDFEQHEDRALLMRLIDHADIVIESSRPRALRQIGIDAEALVACRPGLVWIAISAYGRDANTALRIGYGDDTAAAAGLCTALRDAAGQWAFVEDAIADPLTGIHAAYAAWLQWQSGEAALIALSLHDVVAWSINEVIDVRQMLAQWYRENSAGRRRTPLPPRTIEVSPRAVGADNGRVANLLTAC